MKKSVYSYKSGASNASRMSMKSRIAEEKKREAEAALAKMTKGIHSNYLLI